jgi:cytosolic iron-sulfur protein assembly protein CIAO1
MSLNLLAKKEVHSGPIWCVKWKPQGPKNLYIATCGQDQVIRISKLAKEDATSEIKITNELKGAHSKTIRCLDFSPDGSLLAASSFDGSVSIWQFFSSTHSASGNYTIKCITSLEGHENEVKGVAFSPSGHILATCGRDRTIWLWKIHSEDDAAAEQGIIRHGDYEPEFECLAVLQEHQQDVKSLSWDPNLAGFVSGSYDETARVWSQLDLEDDGDWGCVQTLELGKLGTVWASTFILDFLILVGQSGHLTIYKRDRKTWKIFLPDFLAHDGAIYSIDSFQPNAEIDEAFIISCGEDKCLKLWKLDESTGLTHLGVYSDNFEFNSCAIARNGDQILVSCGDDNGSLHILHLVNN